MKDLNLNKVPKYWDDMSLDTFIKYMNITTADYAKEYKRTFDIIALLMDVKRDVVMNAPMEVIAEIMEKLSWLDREPPTEDRRYIYIDGMKYWAPLKLHDITTAEFIDMYHLTSEKDSIINNLPTLMAIFYRPMSDNGVKRIRYDTDTVPERRDFFLENASGWDAWTAVNFFLSRRLKSIECILRVFSPLPTKFIKKDRMIPTSLKRITTRMTTPRAKQKNS